MPDHPTNPEVRLLDRFFYLDPHPQFRWLREHAPVYWDASADGGLWGIARYEDVLTVSRQPELFCSGKSSRPERDSWIPSMINLDDPLHKRRRNLVNRGFTPKRVEAHEPMLRKLTNELLDAVSPKRPLRFRARRRALDSDGRDRRHARRRARGSRAAAASGPTKCWAAANRRRSRTTTRAGYASARS